MTKSFVAVVVLQLVAEGRLRLAETVSGRLPGLLPTGDRVTVEDLLRHTSGLPDYTEGLLTDPESLLALRHRTWQPRELVELAVRGRPVPRRGRSRTPTPTTSSWGCWWNRSPGGPTGTR